MKKLINLLIFIITINISAQSPFLSIGQDIKMAYEGPYANKPNDIGSTFNLEFKFGLEWEKQRVALGVETHNEINYTKYFGEFGHKFNDFIFKNFTLFTGGEISIIERVSINHHFTNPTHYRPDNHYWSVGTNIELLYNIPNTIISVSINTNIFLPEDKDAYGNKIIKNFRWDTMFNIYLKL